jgi:hypothetical protein
VQSNAIKSSSIVDGARELDRSKGVSIFSNVLIIFVRQARAQRALFFFLFFSLFFSKHNFYIYKNHFKTFFSPKESFYLSK